MQVSFMIISMMSVSALVAVPVAAQVDQNVKHSDSAHIVGTSRGKAAAIDFSKLSKNLDDKSKESKGHKSTSDADDVAKKMLNQVNRIGGFTW